MLLLMMQANAHKIRGNITKCACGTEVSKQISAWVAV